ncbi:unnamed protein product [Clonostachys rosea f. rosea IK726]|uniref:Uncharacterized protein n=1 Tax=Clonostachys rosea f. rosea IK726 TaxID=1349383 RepID=A0ACA9UXV4_BIOOC|nr:unnamed protein product [Clonostachys rosea f. rosea IK726]
MVCKDIMRSRMYEFRREFSMLAPARKMLTPQIGCEWDSPEKTVPVGVVTSRLSVGRSSNANQILSVYEW